MKRESWEFTFTAKDLLAATQAKLAFHQDRFAWWKDKRNKTIAKIKSEGIAIDENLVLESVSIKGRDWERSTQVTIREDLQDNLSECLRKMAFHTGLINQYNAWQQILSANSDEILKVDHDDWLFFYGQVDK